MRGLLRRGLWLVAALLAIMPSGPLTGPLLLAIVADAAVLILLARAIARWRRTKTAAEHAADLVWLRRRMNPGLRRHRPVAVIELQLRWRERSEAASRRRRDAG